jgi:hypothetical protein
MAEIHYLAVNWEITPTNLSKGENTMLTADQFTAAATEVTAMVGLAITGGMGIYGSIKGVQVGLQMFSRLISGR